MYLAEPWTNVKIQTATCAQVTIFLVRNTSKQIINQYYRSPNEMSMKFLEKMKQDESMAATPFQACLADAYQHQIGTNDQTHIP